jgi:hypothetical protein
MGMDGQEADLLGCDKFIYMDSRNSGVGVIFLLK